MARRGGKSSTGADPADRRRLASLARQLSRETGDAKLARLVDLALLVDASPEAGTRATPAERYALRVKRWRLVWAHLAGEPDVLVMGRRALTRDDRVAQIFGALRQGNETPLELAVPELAVLFPTMGSEDRRRGAPIPRERAAAYAARASKLAGAARSLIEVRVFGDRTPVRSWETALPKGKQAARRAVRRQLEAAARTAREIAERKGRIRLDQYPGHLVVYLLHQGHGALRGRSWPQTAQAFFNLPALPYPDWGERLKKDRAHVRAVRHRYEAADELVKRARKQSSP